MKFPKEIDMIQFHCAGSNQLSNRDANALKSCSEKKYLCRRLCLPNIVTGESIKCLWFQHFTQAVERLCRITCKEENLLKASCISLPPRTSLHLLMQLMLSIEKLEASDDGSDRPNSLNPGSNCASIYIASPCDVACGSYSGTRHKGVTCDAQYSLIHRLTPILLRGIVA